MSSVREWRREGLSACYTVDAGANVHAICPQEHKEGVTARLRQIAGVKDVLVAGVGGAARLTEEGRLK